MFFYIAKGLWFLLQPSTLIALLIGYGSILIWTGWARWGRRFVSIGAILLLVAGLSPLGNALILPLEDRFPRAAVDDPPPPTGFIVLGGAEDTAGRRGAWRAGAERGGGAHGRGRDARPPLPRGEDRVFGRRCRHSLQVGKRGGRGGDAAHRARRAARPADPRGEVARHLRERGLSEGGVQRAMASSVPPSAGC